MRTRYQPSEFYYTLYSNVCTNGLDHTNLKQFMSITEIHDRADNVIINITEKSVVFMVEKILYDYSCFS